MLGSILGQKGDRSFKEDERAIEGLPIRLVIALVVGIAALTLMMGVLDTFSFGADQEVDVDFNGDAIVEDDGSSVTLTVVDAETGDAIPEADVIVRGDTLSLDSPHYNTTDDNGNISFDVDESGSEVVPDWQTTQETGEVKFQINPPEDSSYVDERENSKMTVVRVN